MARNPTGPTVEVACIDGTRTRELTVVVSDKAGLPPSFLEVVNQAPVRIDHPLLYPTPTGKLWRERNFYRDVWQPARDATRLDIRPHEMRHSWISHLRAAGIDDSDLADVAARAAPTLRPL
jgi:site-specific recombinase XerD